MTEEYKKLKTFAELENSMHPIDEGRFKGFLAFSKISGEEKMSIATFRSAFEEAYGCKQLDESTYAKIDKLYKRYDKIKN